MTAASVTMRYTDNYVWVDPTDKLGRGATGVVFKCRHQKTGEVFAVKCFENVASHALSRETEVLRILGKIDNKNVMKLLQIESERSGSHGNKVLIMDYCAGGSLSDVLDAPENTCGLADDELILFISDIVKAIEFLRVNDIVHRDIKPGNILKYIAKDGQTYYRLTDFGAARRATDDQALTSIHGTDEYLHPAMYDKAYKFPNPQMRGFKISAKCDLWSLGVTIYQMASGLLPFRPFKGRQDPQTMHKIISERPLNAISGVQDTSGGQIRYSDSLPASCRLSVAFKSFLTPFIAALMEKDFGKMWSFERVFKWAQDLRSSKYMELFVLSACTFDRVYISSLTAGKLADKDKKYDELVRQYVEKQYQISKQDCDLLVPVEKNISLKSRAGQESNDSFNFGTPFATANDLAGILQSCETVRQRVALGDRSNRWDATKFVVQLGALKLIASNGSEASGAPTSRTCAVAICRIDTQKLKSENSNYKAQCAARLKIGNTLYASLHAQIQSCKDGLAYADRLAGTNSSDRSGYYESSVRVGYAYTIYRAGLSLLDAQVLIAASGNHLVASLKRGVHALHEKVTSFESTCDQTLSALTTARISVDLLLEILDVLTSPMPRNSNEPTLTDFQRAMGKLRDIRAKVDKLETDCNAKRNEVSEYMEQYKNVIITEDKVSHSWQTRLRDNHCFGRSGSFGHFARQASKSGRSDDSIAGMQNEQGKVANAVPSSAPTVNSDIPCWRTLQRNLERCSDVYNTIHSKYQKFHTGSYNKPVLEAAQYEKKLLLSLTESSVQRVTRHCWNQTENCYAGFVDWWKVFDSASIRVNKLWVLVDNYHKRLSLVNQSLNKLCTELRSIGESPDVKKINLKARIIDLAAKSSVASGTSGKLNGLQPQMHDVALQTQCASDMAMISRAVAQLDLLIPEVLHQQQATINACPDQEGYETDVS